MNVKPNFNEEVPLTNLPLSAPEMEADRTEAVPEDTKETGEKGKKLNKILPFEEYIEKTQLKEPDFLETSIYKGLYQISDDFRQGKPAGMIEIGEHGQIAHEGRLLGV